jgi:glycerol transport system ATP-binding protein
VYATTEPAEALLLGGYTAVLHEGRLLQYGPTPEVFHKPATLGVAKAFSDPPINVINAQNMGSHILLPSGAALQVASPAHASKTVTVAMRASALKLKGASNDCAITGKVTLAEISGSDTFVHLESNLGDIVAQLTGVHFFDLGTPLTMYVNPLHCFVFDQNEQLLVAAQLRGAL